MSASLATTRIDYELERAILEKTSMLVKKVQDRKTAEIFQHNQEDTLTYDEVQDILELSEEQVKNSKEDIANHKEDDFVIISVLSTMKSLAHTTQSKTRWAQFTKERQMDQDIYTFSSKGDFTRYSEIVDSFTNPKPPRHIVMCTHNVRIDNILKIAIEMEKKNTELKRPRILRVYLDEFDAYVDTMREKINDLVKISCIQSIVIVTATPENIWGIQPEWSRIMILNPKIMDVDDTYLMFRECKHIDTNQLKLLDETPIQYVDFQINEDKHLITHHNKVLQNFPTLLQAGSVIFAPGMVRRKSHECVSQFWNHHNCAVFIFNGERTNEGFYGKLTLPDKSVIDVPRVTRKELDSKEIIKYFKDKKEHTELEAQLNEVIADFYKKYNLCDYPVVMTGLLCIERAQTLVHPVWGSFTDCIYFKAKNPDKSYQQQRQLGHIKKWDTYRGIPRVFAPEEFRTDVRILEDRADNFALKYHGIRATLEDYRNTTGGEKTSAEKKEEKNQQRKDTRAKIVIMDNPEQGFHTIDEANKFLTEKLKHRVKMREFHKTKEGYYVSTRLKNVNKKNKDELTSDDRLTDEKFKRLNKTQNISDGKGQQYMVYPVYPTMTSAPSEVRYFVAYLPPNH
jgi:hypothetical protein